IRRRYLADLVEWNSSQFGEFFRGVTDEGRFVRFTAVGDWCEVRRVGFDQDSVGGSRARDLLYDRGVLEGQDARERHVAAERQATPCELQSGRKAMEDERESPLLRLVFQDRCHVV